ncbi:glycosyltransferase family 4 protein [Novosphingobium sp. 1949]|uniref:Glycosyltransferase family 4 protein n=2 Tax=Novosphingobium organovorum TaxID=2930092 RepID=A0ABT0BE19_9SPHN|nr:glycosyltransferase family 4 protein [Novosphingobium organovorum]
MIGPAARSRIDRVVVLHDYSQALGGASYLVQVLIAELRERDLAVTFFAGDDGGQFHRQDVEFIALGGKALLDRSPFGALTLGLHNPSVRRRLARWIARNDTPGTIYHLHGWSKILSPAVFAALHAVADRLVLHGHDYFNGCPNGAFFDYRREQDCTLRPLSRACLGCSCDKTSGAQKLWRVGREGLRRHWIGGAAQGARLLLIHPGQAPQFEQAGWPREKLVAVRNPVSPPCAERVAAQDNRGVLFIGRISREKGADLAARAAAEAGVPITFVGEGAELEAIRAINPDARFAGRLDRAGVARELARARIAVMPSRWSEPFGLVALEAIGSGVPVIVSQRALVAREIAEKGLGLAVDTADPVAFAEAIRALHADDERVRAMSLAGFEAYRTLCHSPGSWSDAVVDAYGVVLQEAMPA